MDRLREGGTLSKNLEQGRQGLCPLSTDLLPAMDISKTRRLWCSGLVLLFWSEKNWLFECQYMIKDTLWATSGLRKSGPLVLWSSFGLVWSCQLWFGSGLVLWQDRPEPSGFPDAFSEFLCFFMYVST
jgi:hypothetical protein